MRALMRGVALVYVPIAVAVLVLLRIWQGEAEITFAEGVYLFSSRLITQGDVPYRDFIAAHPPLLFYSGAAVLLIEDSLSAIRAALGGLQLLTGLGVAALVWRLTHARAAAVVAGLASLLTPWVLHEHATLMPETLGAACLIAATVLVASGRSVAGGVIAATTIGIKWPFLLPGVLLVFAAPRPGRFLVAFAATFGVGVALSFALFGGQLYDQLVAAQQEIGWHTPRQVAGYLAQAAWNLAPLLLLAAFAWRARARVPDQRALRAVVAVAAGALILVLTVTKTGTYLNVIALAEPFLVVLATVGVTYLLRDRAGAAPRDDGSARGGRLGVVALAALASGLLGVQSVSFLASPTDPGLFVRPGSAPAHGWDRSDAEIVTAVSQARRCPPGVAYSGTPYVAFIARRRMAADEPDQFLLQTKVGAPYLREANADAERCP